MLSGFIELLISLIGTSVLTELFLGILVITFFTSCWWKYKDRHTAFTHYTPTLLTSLGMLGTFMGIVAGLLAFDTANISTSIAPLLEGLKTAFITSLSGMFLSILYKGIAASGLLSKKGENQRVTKDNVTASDLYRVMSTQAESLQQLQRQFCDGNNGNLGDLYHLINQQTSCLERLQTAVGGDGESSLVGQIKLLRSDMNDNQRRSEQHLALSAELLTNLQTVAVDQQKNFSQFEERLGQRLQDFADMMSKSATEQVIEALKGVIQDFNNNLTEQFGENFKQLNSAVLELVAWQENYKQQLLEMKAQYDQGVQAITQTENSVAHISEKAESIPAAMDVLVKVMTVNQHQVDELSRHLEAFEQLRDKAVEAVPEIRSQIDMAIAGAKLANEEMAKGVQESTEQLKAVVTESAENYRSAVDSTREELGAVATITANSGVEIKNQFTIALNEISTNMQELVDELQAGGKELNQSYKTVSTALIVDTESMNRRFREGLEEMQASLARTIEEQAIEHRKQADRVFAGLEGSIREVLTDTGESVQKQVEMIDQTMGQEVEKVMQSMGSALASISGQFTTDYTRLVQQMREITREVA